MFSLENSALALCLFFCLPVTSSRYSKKTKTKTQKDCGLLETGIVFCALVGQRRRLDWLRQEIGTLKWEIGRPVPGTYDKKRKGMTGWLEIILKAALILTWPYIPLTWMDGVLMWQSFWGVKTELVCFLPCVFRDLKERQKPVKEQSWLFWQIAFFT